MLDDVKEPRNAASDEAIGSDEGDGEKILNKATKVSVYLFIVDIETHCFNSVQSSMSFVKPARKTAAPTNVVQKWKAVAAETTTTHQ